MLEQWGRRGPIVVSMLSLILVFGVIGCSNTPDDGLWRGRIEIDKGVRKITSDFPVLHPPDSLAQITFRQEMVIEGRSDDSTRAFPIAYGVATDPQDNVYIADAADCRILKFDADGRFLQSVGTRGSGPTQFQEPVDIAVDKEGKLYVLDFKMGRVAIFKPDLTFHDLFDTPVAQPRRVRVDAEGNVLVFAITQHDLIYKFKPDGTFIESLYDPLESIRIVGNLEQLIAYSDAGMETTEDGYVYVSSRHPYRIRKYDRASGLNVEFSRTTPFDIAPLDQWPGNEQPPPVGLSGALAVLPGGRVMNVIQYQEFKKVGLDSYGQPIVELASVDRWIDMFTPEGKWQMTSKITTPGFPVHTDRKGRVYFNELDPPRVVRYTPEFPRGGEK